jgi:Chaperonin 10 Kd subunit
VTRHGLSFERLGHPIKCVSLNRGSGLKSCQKSAAHWCMLRARPLHDRVAVERIEAEDRTIGGIIMPDTARTVDCG